MVGGNPEFASARINPLDLLQAGDVDITENAMLLADALIMQGSHATGSGQKRPRGCCRAICPLNLLLSDRTRRNLHLLALSENKS